MVKAHYTGKAGQFAVMAELSWRGYNVAIPEVDIGDDVFVLNDASGQLSRIQVKTATGVKLKRTDAYRCQFSARMSHINDAQIQGSHYVLAGRCGRAWRILVFERGILRHLIKNGFGTRMRNDMIMMTVIFFRDRTVKTSTRANSTDLTTYLSNWDAWPVNPSN
jgi:hypothetical protein